MPFVVRVSPRRAWIGFVAVAILVPALFFTLLEYGLRLAGYGYPAAFWLAVPGKQAAAPNYRFGWRFFPPEIARTPEPHLLQRPKPKSVFRIFILGESAAMGFPDPAFSFGRMLGAMLGEMYPGVRFEIVNAAMTAVNSHVILPVARDCAVEQPDLFILYIGNNEVVGPYGPGTVFHGFSPSLPLIRAGIWVRATRTGELLGNLLSHLSPDSGAPRQWQGMAMFLHNQVPVDDPRLKQVYDHFQRNLRDIVHAARRMGAGVILCTVGANLKDSPPFASLHRAGMSPADLSRWDELYRSGVALEQAGDPGGAMQKYREASVADDRYAELQFRIARAALSLRQPEAKRFFDSARDLDALRFRVDSGLNNNVRVLASELRSDGVRFADVEEALREAAPEGIPGREFFYEHVHLNFSGNYQVARAVLSQAIPLLPQWIGSRSAVASPPTESRTAELLAFTDWDRYRAEATIGAMLHQPPFTNQLDSSAEQSRRAIDLAALKQRRDASLPAAKQAYAQAIARDPGDLPLRQHYAALLSEMRDPAAVEQWRFLLAQLPDVALWRQGLAAALASTGQLEASAQEYNRALSLDPGASGAHVGLGSMLERQGNLDAAAREYETALRLDGDLAEAHNNLGLVLRRMGKTAEAARHFQAALRMQPESAETHSNLGSLYAAEGRLSEAIREYSEAVRLAPGFAGAHYNFAAALAQTGRIAESEAQLRQALRLEPPSPRTHAALAGTLAAQQKWNEAIGEYKESLRLQPDSVEVHYNLGLLLSRTGKLPLAIEQYQSAIRLDPNNARVHNNLGSALAQLGRFQDAADHLSIAVRLQPGLIEGHYNLGMALGALGRWTESAREFQAALRLKPDFPAARAALARAQASAR